MLDRRLRDARGFTLIELLVTLIVMAAVLIGVYGTFFRTQSQANRLHKVAETRQSARTAVQLIERETRMAGSGWGRLPIETSNNGTPLTLSAVTPRYGGASGNDSLTLIGAWESSTTITSGMPSPSSILKVANTDGFADGDLVIITNGSSAHMFQCTHVEASSSHLQHNPSSPYNVAGGHNNWPAGGYGVGARCYKITMSSYWIDETTYRKPALIRQQFGQAPSILAYDPAGMRVWYLLENGAWTRNPASMLQVDKVIPVVLTRVRDPRLPALNDSVWAMVRPRTF